VIRRWLRRRRAAQVRRTLLRLPLPLRRLALEILRATP
jgi:hypothetical protein